MDEPLNLREYEARAKERLGLGPYDWFAGGAADEVTLRDNEAAWNRLRLRPRVCVDVSACDLRTTILGQAVQMPIMTAPCSINTMAHPDGELGVARAAAAAGIIQVLSMGSGYDLEAVAAAAPAPRWLQMYCLNDPEVTAAVARRAEAAGYQALCLTVDSPFDGIRDRNARNQFSAPPPGITQNTLLPYRQPDKAFRHDSGLTWKGLEWLRGLTSLPVVVKGILTAEDARLAIEHGAQGIIVSNHGGRQLDTVLATGDALAEVAEAVGGRAEVYVDGGIRRGTDVLKALALGARAALIGRPYLWGLAVNGEAGVSRVITLLRSELERSMSLAGCARLADINRRLVA
jgi:4-hydroxymandelate oxidase